MVTDFPNTRQSTGAHKNCDYLLFNDFYILPTCVSTVQKKPMKLISTYFKKSEASLHVDFSQWLIELNIPFEQMDQLQDSEIEYEMLSLFKDLDRQHVLVTKLFPYGFQFNEHNWNYISSRLKEVVSRKRGVDQKFITLDAFDVHSDLFSSNFEDLLRI